MKRLNLYLIVLLVCASILLAKESKDTKEQVAILVDIIESNKVVINEARERVRDLEITVYGPEVGMYHEGDTH